LGWHAVEAEPFTFAAVGMELEYELGEFRNGKGLGGVR
jgi:hypothetical protein